MNKRVVNNLIDWIFEYVKSTKAKGVVVGMSGGKDSLIVAKLCAMALGSENVFGIIMPNGKMIDIDDAIKSCNLLGIEYTTIKIGNCYDTMIDNVKKAIPNNNVLDVTVINTAPRLRMTTLYAVAGSLNYLVANTSNLSETMVGYTTKWGDNVGDFSPIANFTKTEVCELGILLGLPDELVNKPPRDGLSGKSDEDKLGFSYGELDNLIRKNIKGKNYDKIVLAHKKSLHKRNPIAKFKKIGKNYLKNTKN